MDWKNHVPAARSQLQTFLAILLLTMMAGRFPFSATCAADQSSDPDDLLRTTVAPILSARCIHCHNDSDRRGDLSLQQRTDVLESGYVISGDAAGSGLLAAVTSTDGQRASMPRDGEPLTADEVAAVSRWIEQGAVWPDGFTVQEHIVTDTDWWSLRPVRRPPVPLPSSPDAEWIRTPIDAFILQRLLERKMRPSAEADRRVLIRRLYFDLTGLPPSPQAVHHFQDSQDPQAYEKLVEDLLNSPHYGERWARHWLDVVKYADTSGYDKDKLRPNAWPYRDYVIRAFNQDKPYAQFVQEQLAGDILFPDHADGIVGLGFIAAGPWDWIGHAEVPETKIDGRIARHTDRDEMVANTLNTFCSVTIQCCQCHNHKFDPFTQQHYYNLQSVFAAVDRADRPWDADPAVRQLRLALRQRQSEAETAREQLERVILDEGGDELRQLELEIPSLSQQIGSVVKSAEFGYHSGIAESADVQKWVQIDLGRNVEISRIILHPCHDEFNGIGAGFGFPVRFDVTAHDVTDTSGDRGVVLYDASRVDVPNPGLTPLQIPLEPVTARRIRVSAERLAPRSGDFIFALAEIQVLDAEGVNVALNAGVMALDSIEAPPRWARSNLTDGQWAQPVDSESAKKLAALQVRRKQILDRLMTEERTQQQQLLQEQLKQIHEQLQSLPEEAMVYAAAPDFKPIGTFVPTRGTPRTINRLHRGDVTQPREPAVPGTLPLFAAEHPKTADHHLPLAGRVSWDCDGRFTLPEMPGEADRRAALARWITHPSHPLTWRSIVNRVWQYHFGRGLVESPNDFGRMGELPTHPELLDWLAADFRDNGQSFRSLHRLIVLSSTYRQSGEHQPTYAELDSENRLLWRMNRRRLAAEEIRDAMLEVSGRLDRTMGGPGYYLFALERPEHSPHYEYHKFDPRDPASHRRSVYRFVVRSQPDPLMTTLDCADSSQSTPLRTETLTSLQALSLLNSRFSLAMAEYFAADLRQRYSDPVMLAGEAFQRCTGRAASAAELAEITNYAQQHGLENLCRLMFNLSEFVYVD